MMPLEPDVVVEADRCLAPVGMDELLNLQGVMRFVNIVNVKTPLF